jgi:ATP-dependent DNA ligase
VKYVRNKVCTCEYVLLIWAGITLIEVPYWWDKQLNSLAVTIYNQKPELFETRPQGQPIPSTPTTKQNSKHSIFLFLLFLGTTKKKFLMTATEWDTSENPTGWWMTEKYDGMRLYWDGSQFYSRTGEKVNVPQLITQTLPSTPLDGELWYQLFSV